MLFTSIYGHFRRLKLPTDHEAMCRVGLIVRDLYLAQYGTRPDRRKRMIQDQLMLVNVYPETFAGQVIEVILEDQASQCFPAPAVTPPALPVSAEPLKPKRERIRIRSTQQVYSTLQTGEGQLR